ncbi:phage tail fiber protein [Rahnella aquatilis CIP 78.65 = ATCC 33071]|uniref:Phage-related tail fiber protein n=1 Tax=Rahnella aquatilis (strain ATCC 33071 / DSM 4594 / JCM 1683 / NBRC 105701 / NCIMB 13365 / CIP 78.65) TaxID=745277 RepID=H2IY40_RAHAC|nr:phage tail protein [Rahnella aquatilis]AEX53117.1 phage-related tail fiber protein [Rahnella aquatilis CIP 78.65 = ATCC 33071]KFD04525.1 phage tail fiber protein [Rahnella aquatilis CIP 78.65 = ATCC 33071]
MATKYYALLTNVGTAKLANATALGEQVEITQMAVGDGNGALPTPNPAQTALVHELRRAPLNTLTIDPVNANQIIAEQVIPEDVGGWWIREIGLYDSAGDLIAIANCAETYKPLLQEGSGRVQVIRVILIVSSTQAVTLKIDPSVVLATRQYVDDQIIQVKAYVDQQMAAHVAAIDPHQQYLKTADIVQYIPAGIPLPYPAAMPPAGWLKCNGATFDKVLYPVLAAVFPSGALPDLRGEFIRGWDDGRNVDGVTNRQLLSREPATLTTTSIGPDALQQVSVEGAVPNKATIPDVCEGIGGDPIFDADYGATMKGFVAVSAENAWPGNGRVTDNPDSARPINVNQYYTSVGTRPRNIAFNYIVRAV